MKPDRAAGECKSLNGPKITEPREGSDIPEAILRQDFPHSTIPTERFAQRAAILRDISISDGAKVLYLLMDDEARGEPRFSMRQLRLAVLMGVSVRHLRDRMSELESAGYIKARRTMSGNVYDFHRNHSSHAEGNHSSSRRGTTVPVALQGTRARQETTRNNTPLTPLRGEPAFIKCPMCRGRGARPGAFANSCPQCAGRRVVAA